MKKEDVLKMVSKLNLGEMQLVSENLEDANIVIETAILENLKYTHETGIGIMPRISKEGIFIEYVIASVCDAD